MMYHFNQRIVYDGSPFKRDSYSEDSAVDVNISVMKRDDVPRNFQRIGYSIVIRDKLK